MEESALIANLSESSPKIPTNRASRTLFAFTGFGYPSAAARLSDFHHAEIDLRHYVLNEMILNATLQFFGAQLNFPLRQLISNRHEGVGRTVETDDIRE